MKLTENFYLSEFCQSDTADKYGIILKPNAEQVANIKALCENVLQPARDWFGDPLHITSGFRTPQLNVLIKGAKKSQHLEGKAADIVCSDTNQLYRYIKNNLDYDQIIAEGIENGMPKWIHVSYNGKNNRHEDLIAVFSNNIAKYIPFTIDNYKKVFDIYL